MSRELERLLSSQEPTVETKRMRLGSDIQAPREDGMNFSQASIGANDTSLSRPRPESIPPPWPKLGANSKNHNEHHRPLTSSHSFVSLICTLWLPLWQWGVSSKFEVIVEYCRRRLWTIYTSTFLLNLISISILTINSKMQSLFWVPLMLIRHYQQVHLLQAQILLNSPQKHGTSSTFIFPIRIRGFPSLKNMISSAHPTSTLKVTELHRCKYAHSMYETRYRTLFWLMLINARLCISWLQPLW